MSARLCGKTPSSRPVRKTLENSRPLALCSVISVTYDASSSSESRSLTSAMLARKPASDGSSSFASYSRATPTSSCRFSKRARASCVSSALQLAHVARIFHHGDEQIGDAHASRRACGSRAISSAKRSSSLSFFGTAARSSSLLKIASPTERPRAFAACTSAASVCCPMPRRGTLTIRLNASASDGVHDVAQVRDDVFDLGARVEADAADDAIRNAVGEQRLFEDARLRVGAIEHDEIAIGRAVADHALDLLDDVARFVAFGRRRIDRDRLALVARGEELLRRARAVVGDQRVGGIENALRAAIVLFELEDLRARESLPRSAGSCDSRCRATNRSIDRRRRRP